MGWNEVDSARLAEQLERIERKLDWLRGRIRPRWEKDEKRGGWWPVISDEPYPGEAGSAEKSVEEGE